MIFFLSVLQVTEMFSSEGDLHLELPTGDLEAPKRYWVSLFYTDNGAPIEINFLGCSEFAKISVKIAVDIY